MPDKIHRRKIMVNGVVQGVGFRPFVYNLARRCGLTGSVANNSPGVKVEVEGHAPELDRFEKSLQEELPAQALLVDYRSEDVPAVGTQDFVIDLSEVSGRAATLVAPDLALCRDCLAELFDPADRRYRYPFINCTNCGPRYSIVTGIPYDRAATAMRHFEMCEDCHREYRDPTDRRFHAQPNACPICGPQISLCDGGGSTVAQGPQVVIKAAELLTEGRVLAIKGLGGFHLAVDAGNEDAVRLLRQRKGREEKPLAVMVADLDKARRLCLLNQTEAEALTSASAPILLAPIRSDNGVASSVAPFVSKLGVMLAYTPLHHLLLREFAGPLVMTSGNLSEEPICIDNNEAVARLAGIADYFLSHDREIYMRSDDSVVVEMAGKIRPLRRGRGYVPRPIQLATGGPQVLAVGGELKNTVCLLKDDQAFPSRHLGDIKNLGAYGFFQETIVHLQKIFEAGPQLVVHDLHPAYLSTRWAREEQNLPILAVQHHHAHLAACLAENQAEGPAIGIILDGSGYGPDGTIWGGEILTGDFSGFQRHGCLEPMPLPGGDAAVKAPWRTALAYLDMAYDGSGPVLPFLAEHDSGPVREMLRHNLNCPLTSSCGRLFDAVEAVSGGRQVIAYEGQAAIELMEAAGQDIAEPYYWDIVENGDIFHLGVRGLIHQVAAEVAAGATRQSISRRFHRTLVEMLAGAAERVRDGSAINTVVLSGGVFNNYLLLEGLIALLEAKGFEVLTHSQLPAGDGCLALGQAMIGRQYLSDN
jgi:hydrogenase maturation protein HypF